MEKEVKNKYFSKIILKNAAKQHSFELMLSNLCTATAQNIPKKANQSKVSMVCLQFSFW